MGAGCICNSSLSSESSVLSVAYFMLYDYILYWSSMHACLFPIRESHAMHVPCRSMMFLHHNLQWLDGQVYPSSTQAQGRGQRSMPKPHRNQYPPFTISYLLGVLLGCGQGDPMTLFPARISVFTGEQSGRQKLANRVRHSFGKMIL